MKNKLIKIIEGIILILIVISLANFVIEEFYNHIFVAYKSLFLITNNIILGVFTAEYLVRLYLSKEKFKYIRKPSSIIDFLAIAPSYVELIFSAVATNTSALRALRFIRLLRISRALRIFKLFKYGDFLKKIFKYENTILEKITPVISIFIFLKGIVWLLEWKGYWIKDSDLGELFAIIGFALGIILSQKISLSFNKFIEIENAIERIYANLEALNLFLKRKESSDNAGASWARIFIKTLQDTKASNLEMVEANENLYLEVKKIEEMPADISMTYLALMQDARFCLSQKTRLTPKAYDTLLHQSSILYFLLIVIFIPGTTGMVSVIVATYILYGMYNLTQDLDTILGGDFNLISIDIEELKKFAN